jgi:uncharacterized membrane protein YkvA (DUF1232 family)
VKVIRILKQKAKELKTEIYALYLVYKDPRVPWYKKAFIFIIIAYAINPLDLIPDFIPVLGYLDDLIIIPLGIYLALKMIPKEILKECREKARREPIKMKTRWVVAAIIVFIWLVLVYLIFKLIWEIILKKPPISF